MKILQRTLSLFSILALATLCNAGHPTGASIFQGKLISIEPQESAETEDSTDTSPDSPPIEPVDFSKATLTIAVEMTNAEGEVETDTLYEGSFDGDFQHTVKIDGAMAKYADPTDIKISLQVTDDSEPMTISTVIANGSDVDFVYIDHPGARDEFLLIGTSSQVKNPDNKFSISGDLSFLELDSAHTTSAMVWANFFNSDGEREGKQWGPVLVQDESFLIEGDIERPIVASLYLRNMNRDAFYNTSTRIILEPNGEINVAQLGDQTQEIGTVSGTGYHAALIESWQQDKQYLVLVEDWLKEQERSQNPPDEPEVADVDEDTTDIESEEAADTDDSATVEASVEIVEVIDPAEGCEDAVAQQELPATEEETPSYEPPYWYTLRMKATDFQNEKLKDIAMNSKDPTARLLAMQMNIFSPYEDAEKALTVWKTLVDKFDDDFVATYIAPEIERIELVHTRTLNDEALVPGQKVPEFTLASLAGEDVAIYDLMGEKDMVLIDFWASWCGPCIATFPDLKKLHAAYTDENFEIVGVSIDNNQEDWTGGVEDHELPWVQLGELKDVDDGNPVAKSYGVNFIPKTFLVDSQGCIYRKNIHPTELKTFLVDRYGLDESLVEPEEVEDSPEISS